MFGVIAYLRWRGDIPFSCAPLNEVDCLIFTQIVYLDFEGIVPGMESGASISLKKAGERFLDKWKTRYMGGEVPMLIRDCILILQEMLQTQRFADCRMTKYTNEINKEEEYQFSAMKILPGDGSSFLAFRGTDTTITGWKENFNMSYLEATPGQKKAVEYTKRVLPGGIGNLSIGGHSKGGNLALYAALKSGPEIKRKLQYVYNFDGPGFSERVVKEAEYRSLQGKIRRYLPEFSIVGILLEQEEKYQVVKSSEKGILQHRAISWEVMGNTFIYLEHLSKESLFWKKTLQKWVHELTLPERREFVEVLFSVFEQAGIENPGQLKKMTIGRLAALIKAMDRLEPQEKKTLLRMVHTLMEQVEKNR